jgi:hypothetical protein
LVEKCEETRLLGGATSSLEASISCGLEGKECEGVEWLQVAQDRDMWRAVVKKEMNLPVPYKWGIFRPAGRFNYLKIAFNARSQTLSRIRTRS